MFVFNRWHGDLFGDGSTDPGVVPLEQNMSCFSRCGSPSLKNIIETTYPLNIGLPKFFS